MDIKIYKVDIVAGVHIFLGKYDREMVGTSPDFSTQKN